MFYYTFTTFDCNFIPRNAEICKVSSETKNVGKAHKYRLNRHLPTYEKIIKNLYSFFLLKKYLRSRNNKLYTLYRTALAMSQKVTTRNWAVAFWLYSILYYTDFLRRNSICPLKKRVCPGNHCPGSLCSLSQQFIFPVFRMPFP